MLKRQFQNQTQLWTKTALFNIFLVANSFVWYYSVLNSFQDSVETLPANSTSTLLIWVIHFSGLIISAIVGASLTKKIDRKHLLIFWIILCIIASFSLLSLNVSNTIITSMVGLFLGISLGLGMPACMSLYTDSIPVENRGRVGGITMLITGMGIFAFSILPINEGIVLVISLATWRVASLVFLLSAKSPIRVKDKTNIKSFKHVLGQKSFFLYFIPWFMFGLVNYLTAPLVNSGTDIEGNVMLVQTGFMGAFAVLGGYLIDSVGRKRVAIAGFTMLGIGTAVLGISSGNDIILYFNAALDGIAWGFLLVLFILTLWGDLIDNSQSDKYYAIGVLPFFMSMLLEKTVGQYLAPIKDLNQYAFFSFTAFFLFIAVLPLVYAPETLPEKTMKDRDLKSYIEKAQKIVNKKVEKKQKQKPNKDGNKDEETAEEPQESPIDEEARKLAEKYY